MIITYKRYAVILVAIAMSVFMLSACGGEDNTDRIARRQYGINCLNAGNYDQAIEAFKTVLSNSKNGISNFEIDVCLYKAKAQYLGGYTDDAIETYTALIDYDDNAAAYFGRACIYLETGKIDEALSDFQEAIDEDGKNYDLYIGTAETLIKHGYEDKAKEYLQQALNLKGKSANVNMQKGRIYILLGQTSDAIEILQKAIDADEIKAYYYMGQAYTVDGNTELASKYFEQYIKSGDASADELMSVGENQMKQEQYDTAISYFEGAQAMEEGVSNLAQLRKDLIICYEMKKDFANAKSLMEEYVKDYPDDEEAAREYLFLKTR